MMTLDTRTIMVMVALWTLMLSGLLMLTASHAKEIGGIRRWALANICIGFGLGMAYFQTGPGGTLILVIGATFLALGMCLQYQSLQEFNGQTPSRIVLLLPILVYVQTFVFVFVFPSVNLRTMANPIVLGLLNAASARLLLVRVKGPLATAYGLTGISFAGLSALLVLRAANVIASYDVDHRLYSSAQFNPTAFVLGGIFELCVTFGFMLMIFYRLTSELHELAIRDSLTGAYNRRNLNDEAPRITSLCTRNKAPLSVMMIDMDHFKAINDQYGHVAGDLVLKNLAEIVRKTIRAHDYFVRYGGEEFCILLPTTNREQAKMLAERLRIRVAESGVQSEKEHIKCTVSIGVADAPCDRLDLPTLLSNADQALYEAKHSGRNRVVALGDAQGQAGEKVSGPVMAEAAEAQV